MTQLPDPILSRLDVERIERLIDSGDYDDHDGVDALVAKLDRGQICEPDAVPDGVVTMNSTVRFRDESNARVQEVTLVYPPRANAEVGYISIFSAASSALLGMRVGQHIEWPTKSGRILQICVEGIVYQPEAGGELHR